MWNCVQQKILLRVPNLRQIERGLRSTKAASFHFDSVLDNLRCIPYSVRPKLPSRFGSCTPTMPYTSTHQHRNESSSVDAAVTSKEGVVERTIREKLEAALPPITHLTIVNESHRHNV
jgi:hypothetical protein